MGIFVWRGVGWKLETGEVWIGAPVGGENGLVDNLTLRGRIVAECEDVQRSIQRFRENKAIFSIAMIENDLFWSLEEILESPIHGVGHFWMMIDAMIHKIRFTDIDC